MPTSTKFILPIVIAIGLVLPLTTLSKQISAQQEGTRPVTESVKVPAAEIRSFNGQELKKLREDTEYQWDRAHRTVPPDALWWEVILNKIAQFTLKLFSISLVKYGLIIIAVLLLVYTLLRMLGVDVTAIFIKGKSLKHSIPFDIHEESIRGRNFEDEVRIATKNGDYRLAIRLSYLFALKKLDDKGIIRWKPYKTNTDYLTEIGKSNPAHQALSQMSYYFDYVWYGQFTASKAIYDRTCSSLQQIEALNNKQK